MGNCQGCLASTSVHDAEEDSVKLVRVTDGQIFEYPGPVNIKDLLFGFEGFAVFQYDTVEQPLPPETELKFNEVYYLRPWKSPKGLDKPSNDGKPGSCGKLGCLRSSLQNPATEDRSKVKKVRFVDERAQDASTRCEIFCPPVCRRSCASSGTTELRPSIELLPRQPNGVVRLKLVVSKSELADLMAKTEDTDTVLARIVTPLRSLKRAACATETTRSFSPKSWKPLLEHIPEEPDDRWCSLSRSSSRKTKLPDCIQLER